MLKRGRFEKKNLNDIFAERIEFSVCDVCLVWSPEKHSYNICISLFNQKSVHRVHIIQWGWLKLVVLGTCAGVLVYVALTNAMKERGLFGHISGKGSELHVLCIIMQIPFVLPI